MGQITYKAFGKKFQNPGAVITALTFLWAWREDGNHLAIEQYKQSCRDEHINQNCTFTCFCWKSYLNKGHKRMSFLREAMGGEKITFGGNYETRWAASEKKAVKVIINHHGKIVKALEDLSMDTSFRTEVRQTAVGLVKQLSNKNVMLILYFFYDVLDVIETLSLQFQKRYGLLVDQCKNIEDMTSSLRKIGS